MAENSYRIFVGAFPTGDLAEKIQAVRAHYDPKTARITPPHVTLAGTYWRGGPPTETNEAQAIQRLAGLAGQIQPFDLILGGVRSFAGQNPVIYLDVEITPGLLAARQELLQVLGPDNHRHFEAHLTLAMRLDRAHAGAMLAEMENSAWSRERFVAPIYELRLMQRGPQDTSWRCIYTLSLSAPGIGPASPPRGAGGG